MPLTQHRVARAPQRNKLTALVWRVLWLARSWVEAERHRRDCLKDRALACLPCFLAGCRGFLAVAGASYTQRLWCAAVCPRGP